MSNGLEPEDVPRARFLGPPEAKFGSRFDPVAGRQEQFHGFFTRTEPDNRYFLEIGFTHMSFLEVQGLKKFRRAGGTFRVISVGPSNAGGRLVLTFCETARAYPCSTL